MTFELPTDNKTEQEGEAAKMPPGWSYRGENLRTTMKMQFELARHYYGLPEDASEADVSEVALRWADMDDSINCERFRNFVEANPKILDIYRTDPHKALEIISSRIYEHQPIIAEKEFQIYQK